MGLNKFSKYSKEEVVEAVLKNKNLADTMRCLGLIPRGSNYARFKKMLEYFNISTTHFVKNSGMLNLTSHHHTKESFICEVLVKNGKGWVSFNLKNKLYDYNLLEKKCSECGQGMVWNNKKLGLQLDHINGDAQDNQLSNLRILCPNCHSQTRTFCKQHRNK